MSKRRTTSAIREGECPGEPEQILDRIFEFDSPESSTVIRGEYDWDTCQLLVTFKAGSRYRFKIPEEMWQEFAMAESKGGYFAARIRPFYLGEKL